MEQNETRLGIVFSIYQILRGKNKKEKRKVTSNMAKVEIAILDVA